MRNWEDDIWLFDFEVLYDDWIMCARNYKTREKFFAHNDPISVCEFIYETNPILVGYNSKDYDNYILKGIMCGYEPSMIKRINDFIIVEGNKGWEFPFKHKIKLPDTSDLMLDIRGISLKEIEGNLGLNIVESSIPFDIDRKLTSEELSELIYYCWNDVDSLIPLFEERKGYLEAKVFIGNKAGIDERRSLYYTNAQLTALVLKAKRQEYDDEYDYEYREENDLSYVPKEVIDFVERYRNKEIILNKNEGLDEESISKSKFKLDFLIGSTPHTLGLGGLHGAIPNYIEESSNTRIILNADVESYYPSMIIEFDYLSRNVPDKQLFVDIRNERFEAKHSGNKKVSNALKLPLNTVFGAQLNQYNDLYDPLMGRSICITGQLLLIELANRLLEIPTLRLIQSNTDGIMFSVDKIYREKAESIIKFWQDKTRLGMEIDEIDKVVQKDVNNYCILMSNGKVKVKGGFVNNYEGGDFKNKTFSIVAKAVVDYLLKGIPPEETIRNCKDPLMFQLIGKAGRTYDSVVIEKY